MKKIQQNSKQTCNICENFLCSNGKTYCTEHDIELHETFDAWGEPQNTYCEMFVEKEKEVESRE